jgi:hypothetical protein
MKLTTHLHLVPRLRMRGAIPPLLIRLHGVVLKEAMDTKVYPKVSELAAWSENCKWYSSLPLGAVVSLFYESVW